MHESAGKIAGGLVLLVAVWIGIYWLWPSEPKISFAQGDETIRGAPVRHTEDVPPVHPPDPKPLTDLKADPKPQTDPQIAVIPPEFTQYTVKDGDTFASIARHYYGSSALSSVIIAANPLMSPDHLTIGRVIKIPKDPNNIQGKPVAPGTNPALTPTPSPTLPAAPGPGDREYIVQSGDSLSKIAADMYGDFRLSSLIYDANRDQLPNEHALKIGQKLRIPPRPQR